MSEDESAGACESGGGSGGLDVVGWSTVVGWLSMMGPSSNEGWFAGMVAGWWVAEGVGDWWVVW